MKEVEKSVYFIYLFIYLMNVNVRVTAISPEGPFRKSEGLVNRCFVSCFIKFVKFTEKVVNFWQGFHCRRGIFP